MAAKVDFGMDLADMKKLLMVSKRQPVNCGVGLSKIGVVLMMDKIKQPKALLKDLEKKFSDMKAPHWGTAFVDTDEDPKLLVLILNKAAPSGMAKKMKKTLKGTGFSKVEIRTEDGTVADKAGEEDEEEAEGSESASTAAGPEAAASAPAAPAAAPEPAPAAPVEPAAASSEAAPAAASPEAPPAAAPDAGALTRTLRDLVGKIGAADPAQASTLKQLATQAGTAIKGGDLQTAQQQITQLQEALGAAPAAPPPAAPSPAAANGAAQTGTAAPNMAALGKARIAWSATRQKVESELGKLHKEMAQAYQGHGFAADLDKVFTAKVEPVLSTLDESLADKLNEVTNNSDPAQHAKLVGEAKQILQRYESYLAGEPLIAKLDANPFVPLQLQKTLTATLAALSRAIA